MRAKTLSAKAASDATAKQQAAAAAAARAASARSPKEKEKESLGSEVGIRVVGHFFIMGIYHTIP